MLATQRNRNVRATAATLFIGVAFIVCLVKFVFVVSVSFETPTKEPTNADVQMVRLDTGMLAPITVQNKKGEFVIEVNSDDLDDVLSLEPRKDYPQVPHLLLHDPSICQNSPNLSFILYVHSAPGNAERRQLLRQTYANTQLFKNLRFQVVFLLGLPKERGVQEEVKAEFEQHRDIVQGYFVDDYRNITLKALMGLNWISSHCKQAGFAIKVDDDTFLNIFEMVSLLEQNSNRSLLLVCPIWREGTMRILRERKSCMKWCVTKREFPGDFYPRYCAGIGYMLSQSLVHRLSKAAETTPFFWIDDVYVTGLLTQRLMDQIHYVDVMEHFTVNEKAAMEQYTNTSQPISIHLIHVRNAENFLPLWKALLSRLSQDQQRTLSDRALKAFT